MSADKYTVYNSTSPAKKAELYFEYLDELLRFCAEKNIAFIKADQILYQLDKHINDSVGLDGKPKKQRRQPREGWEE